MCLTLSHSLTKIEWLGHTVVNESSRRGTVRRSFHLFCFRMLQFAGNEISLRCIYTHISLQTGMGYIFLPFSCFWLTAVFANCLCNKTHHPESLKVTLALEMQPEFRYYRYTTRCCRNPEGYRTCIDQYLGCLQIVTNTCLENTEVLFIHSCEISGFCVLSI
jgi:hypothetical protein